MKKSAFRKFFLFVILGVLMIVALCGRHMSHNSETVPLVANHPDVGEHKPGVSDNSSYADLDEDTIRVPSSASKSKTPSESVYVKYRGVVDLDGFKCAWTRSSFVNRICYLEESSYLLVSLNGTYYHYCGVPKRLHNSWISAPSKGKFYHAYVKGRYDCRLSGY